MFESQSPETVKKKLGKTGLKQLENLLVKNERGPAKDFYFW